MRLIPITAFYQYKISMNMKNLIVILCFLLSVRCIAQEAALVPFPVRPVTDEYYEKVVVDPYRHMEYMDSSVQRWFKQQGPT